MPYYLSRTIVGVSEVSAFNDGFTVEVKWNTAYPESVLLNIAYHIYYSTDSETVFSEGVKFIALTGNSARIADLTPGDTYFFAVRAVEYDPNIVSPSQLIPVTDVLFAYPSTMLTQNILATDTTIPVISTTRFPDSGLIRIGIELIRYTVKGATFFLTNSSGRGYAATTASHHDTDGYDGTRIQDTNIGLFLGTEDQNTKIYNVLCRFDLDHFSYRTADGYAQRLKDFMTSDLASSDLANEDFQSYDYAGWHRTDPTLLLNGECVDTYIGGEQGCADGYGGVGRVRRGLSIQEQNNQRQEFLLNVIGEPVVLVKKQRAGIYCKCYLPSSEYPDNRCPVCLGSGFVSGWEQYFNQRRSDRRIMVRFGPVDDKLKSGEAGLDPGIIFDCWTLTVPTIKDRDFIIRFDQDGNEEFRYEVLSVSRNRLLQSLMGGQKFKAQRIQKTDPIYQVRVLRDAAPLPRVLTTSIASSPGILPHSHQIVVVDGVTTLSEVNQTTSIAQGHSHQIIDGIVQTQWLGHTHTIVI